MSAYIVVNSRITDPDRAVTLEGEPHRSRVVIIRLPDSAEAMAWMV